MYIARKFMLTVSHNGNPIICEYIEMKYTENLNNVLNQNVNMAKRARFATFAISIVSYCSSINRTQSKDDCVIYNQLAIRIKFHDHS